MMNIKDNVGAKGCTIHNKGLLIKVLLLIALFMSSVASMAQAPILKIGLIADIQYCNCESAGAREYTKSLVKLDEAVQVINQEKADLTVEVGDMIDRDFASFDPVFKKLNNLTAKWIFVPGNHDFNVPDSLKKTVFKMIGSKKGYHAEVVKGIRLLYLNGFENSVIAWSKETKDYKENKDRLKRLEKAKAKNASDWNGGLGKKQLEWVKSEVEKANQLNQKLIVFGHQPIVPGEEHSLWDSKKLIEALAAFQHQVLYICGHKHSGGDHTIGNTWIINLKGMVEQVSPSFGVLSIYPDGYELKGYGGEDYFKGKL
jgi:predicted phosphodiesterase